MPRISLSWALILGLLSGIGPLCTDFYLPALPDITQQLQATSTQTQLSLTAALIGLGLGQLFFGPLSDRIGRLKPLALSLLLFIFSSAMCALTRDINMLIVWRFLQGFAGAGGSVLSRSIARDKYQGTLLTQFFALLMTVNGIAPVLSPVLGGYIITAFDWRVLFWTMAAIGGVLLLMSLAILRETRPAAHPQTDTQHNSAAESLLNRFFLSRILITTLSVTAILTYVNVSPVLMMEEMGFDRGTYSMAMALMAMVSMAVSFSTPFALTLFKPRTLMLTSQALFLAAGVVLSLAASQPITMVGLGMICAGFSVGFGVAMSQALGPFTLRAGVASSALGIAQVCGSSLWIWLAAIIGLSAMNMLIGILIACSIVSIVLILVVSPARVTQHDEETPVESRS